MQQGKLFDAKPVFEPANRLRALTWKQPYASLMLEGKIETRTWWTWYRGWVLICSSKSPYPNHAVLNISGNRQVVRIEQALAGKVVPDGVAFAIGRLIACRPMHKTDEDDCFVAYQPNLCCHIYADVQPIEHFPWKGSQGWKEVPDEIKKQIRILK